MLYLIVPPIIIVICLALLIFLISRKIPNGAQFQMSEQGENGLTQPAKPGLISKLGQLALRVLEKTTQRFKIFSLKFHNLSSKWLQSIKEKKKNNVVEIKEEIKEEEIQTPPVENQGDEFVRKLSDWKIERKTRIIAVKEEDEKTGEEIVTRAEIEVETEIDTGVEKIERPMISEVAVQPEPGFARSPLEEMLIQRIAGSPRDLGSYEKLGDLYFEQKNLQDAKNCYKQILKINPANRRVKIKMRRLERIMGR